MLKISAERFAGMQNHTISCEKDSEIYKKLKPDILHIKPAEDLLPRRFYMQEKSSCRTASGIKPDTVYHTLKQNIRFLHIFLIGDKTEIYVSTADIH